MMFAKLVFVVLVPFASAADTVSLTTATFANHIKDNKQTLIEFYAPWCGHCKKLEPELEKAAGIMKDKNIMIAKVDATEEKDLATKYNVKGFPTLIWFEDAKNIEYDGGRTSDTIVEWITSMIGTAVTETASPPEASGDKPRVVLLAETMSPGFEAAAKAQRRKASWYFMKSGGATPKIMLQHKGEEVIELTMGYDVTEAVSAFVTDNVFPLFGKLDGDSFDKYMEQGKGLVWTLFPNEGSYEVTEAKQRGMMTEVAKKFKGKYFVTMTDVDKFKDAVENMLSVKEYPAIAVQKKAGDKKKYVYDGEMTATKIIQFIQDVDAGNQQPKLKSEPVPAANDQEVKTIVGSTLQKELFVPDKDVLLEVYAPWCGHCKKLDPEYSKLAKKIKKEGLTDLLTILKIDGTTNDSPVDSVDWTGFPTIFFAKAGSNEATLYDGERTAKGLWKHIKKHATKAQEIKERIEKRKGASKKGDEL